MEQELRFELQPATLLAGETHSLKLALRHPFDDLLHNFHMRIRGEGEVQVLGGAKFQFSLLEPGKTYLVDLLLKGKRPGSAAIHLDRLSARLGGRTMDFPEVTLLLEVLPPTASSARKLFLISDLTPLQQHAQTDLRLRLRNNSAVQLDDIVLHSRSEQIAVLSGAEIQLGDLAPGCEMGVNLKVKPHEAGDLSLVVQLNGLAAGQPVQRAFEVSLTVRPGTRVQETHTHIHGDVVQVGKGHVIGNAADSGGSPNKAIGVAAEGSGNAFLSRHEAKETTRSCPSCGVEVPPGRFCDHCGCMFNSKV